MLSFGANRVVLPKAPSNQATAFIYSETDARTKFRGEESHLWRGGITPINEKIRKTKEYKKWRASVFTRDDFRCQACAVRGGDLHAHHDLPFATYPELRFEVLNGVTLCVPCHRLTPTYGRFVLTN